MTPYLKFEGEPCAINSYHGNLRWRDTGVCVTCVRNQARDARQAEKRGEPKADKREAAARHALAAGDVIYQSNVWCMACLAYPHRIAATQRCMRCHPDEVNAEARAIVARHRDGL